MSTVNAKKIKEAYLSFLTTFMGFYNIEGNIINALKSTAPYISEPLRSIIKRNVFLYEKTQISVDECLENMAAEAGNKEFRKFINFAKMNAKYGGNFNKALMKLREQGEKLFSLESIKSANASVGSMIILVMIVINLLLMMNISADPDIVYIVKNTITGQAIAISNAVSIVFGLYMIKNINSSA
jgi:tight adherence protein B